MRRGGVIMAAAAISSTSTGQWTKSNLSTTTRIQIAWKMELSCPQSDYPYFSSYATGPPNQTSPPDASRCAWSRKWTKPSKPSPVTPRIQLPEKNTRTFFVTYWNTSPLCSEPWIRKTYLSNLQNHIHILNLYSHINLQLREGICKLFGDSCHFHN